MSSLLIFAIGYTLVVVIVILIVRPVILWFWKIDKLHSQLEEQTRILRIAFKDQLDAADDLPSEIIEDTSVRDDIKYNFPDNITNEKKEEIISKSIKLRSGQVLSMDSKTMQIDFWLEDQFNEFRKSENAETLSLVAIKK